MNFLGWINLSVVFFLFAVIHEGSAEPSNWAQIVFRAKQAEARRNRLKFQNEDLKGTPLYASFILTGGRNPLTDFVLPELVKEPDSDKLVQKFQRSGDNFHLVCRKREKPAGCSSVQDTAVSYLGTGNAFFYAPARISARAGGTRDTFDLVPTTLSETERAYHDEKNKTMFNLCGNPPMPGILLHTTTTSSNVSLFSSSSTGKYVTYKYGESGYKCDYFEFGVESIPYNQDNREGFDELKEKGAWARLYNVCYDKENFVTGFTKHTIYSEYITHRKLNFNLDFSPFENLYVKDNLDRFYDLDNQEQSFLSDPKTYIKELNAFDAESNYLVRTRLIPEFDMLYESWQYGVNNALNYAPMWRLVNMGQWLKVEQDIRHLAYKFNKEALTVYTGVYYKTDPPRLYYNRQKSISEPSTSKKKHPFIHLSKSTSSTIYESIPIPSIFFKYVHSIEAGIVLITANGVSGSLKDISCENVCLQYGWHFADAEFKHRNTEEFGMTKCCTPKDFFSKKRFQEFIPNPPSDDKSPIRKILTGGGQAVFPGPRYQQPPPPPPPTAGEVADTMPFANRPEVGQTTHYLIGGGLRP